MPPMLKPVLASFGIESFCAFVNEKNKEKMIVISRVIFMILSLVSFKNSKKDGFIVCEKEIIKTNYYLVAFMI